MAFLKQLGTYPSNDQLNNATRNGATSTSIFLKSQVERGSSDDCLFGDDIRSFSTSSLVTK